MLELGIRLVPAGIVVARLAKTGCKDAKMAEFIPHILFAETKRPV